MFRAAKTADRDAVFDLPPGYTAKLPEQFARVSSDEIRAACRRQLRPDDAVTVAVTTAEHAKDALAASGAGALTVVDHDEY